MQALLNLFTKRSTSESPYLNNEFKICFVGKTKTGKSSIINAVRGLYKNDPGYAPTSHELTQCTLENKEYDFVRDSKRYNIKLVDSKGVNNDDINPTSIDKLIKDYDAIIFVTNDALLKEDIDLFQNIEKQPFILFFVRTHFDSILDSELNNTKILDDSMETQIRDETINKLKKEMKDLLNESKISKVLTEHTLYLITSTTRQFMKSPDGKRLVNDLIALETLKKNEKIDLTQPSSYHLIRYKRNFFIQNLWDCLLKVGITSFSSIIPFLDTIFSKMVIDDKRIKWLEDFGIQTLLDMHTQNELDRLGKPEEVTERLKIKLNEIEREKYYFDLDKFKEIFKSSDSPELTSESHDQLKKFYTDGNVVSEIVKLSTLSGGAGVSSIFKISSKTAGKAFVFAIPFFCATYIYITFKSLKKMIDLCEHYAIEIYNIIHDNNEE